MEGVMVTDNLLPELWPLHRIAKQLGKATHVLVDASRRGEFPGIIRFGAVWYVKADSMRAWIEKNHAATTVTPAQIDQIRQAGRAAAAPQPSPRPRQPRARSAASS
jgi:hypothetical protein